MLFAKYSIVRCPVCGQAGKNLKYVEKDEKIGCRKCGAKTRAARWTECDWHPYRMRMRQGSARSLTRRYAKQLAEAINMSKKELVRMIQE